MKTLFITCAIAIALAACGGGGDDDGPGLAPDVLQDPTQCKTCHPQHYSQWSGSMHAYASVDPVFVAMNARGQRETQGQLGTFCLQCHAPMAVALGLTTGSDYDPTKLSPATNGITCYFCHDVAKVAGDHNNPLQLALDSTMHGGLEDPVASPAHKSVYDTLMDSDVNNSEMCGSCHDLTTVAIPGHGSGGVQLERTFAEWKTTFFSDANPMHHLSCGGCHMPSSDGVVADAPGLDVPERPNGVHDHLWPAIDQAVTDFPNAAAMGSGIAAILDPSVGVVGPAEPGTDIPTGGICVTPDMGGEITVRMDALSVGHAWPTGASQDRRGWLEVIAYDAGSNVLFSSGAVPDGVDPDVLAGSDSEMFTMWDRPFDGSGSAAPFFWDVDSEDTTHHLKQPVTIDPNNPLFDHSSTQAFIVGGIRANIDHITARVRIRPYNYALLNDLVSSGDLDASVIAKVPTYDVLGTVTTWHAATVNPVTGCNDDDP
jgi:hypothetical protein